MSDNISTSPLFWPKYLEVASPEDQAQVKGTGSGGGPTRGALEQLGKLAVKHYIAKANLAKKPEEQQTSKEVHERFAVYDQFVKGYRGNMTYQRTHELEYATFALADPKAHSHDNDAVSGQYWRLAGLREVKGQLDVVALVHSMDAGIKLAQT